MQSEAASQKSEPWFHDLNDKCPFELEVEVTVSTFLQGGFTL